MFIFSPGKWILTVDYLTNSSREGRWLSEEEYEWNTSKLHMAPRLDNIESMLAATTRWRKQIAGGLPGAFFGWRAAVLVNSDRKEVYKR